MDDRKPEMSEPIALIFAGTKATLTWQDILYGYRHGLVTTDFVQQMALTCLSKMEEPVDDLIVELSWTDKNNAQEIERLLTALGTNGVDEASSTRRKWICLGLSWIRNQYENIEAAPKLLDRLIMNLDYPEELTDLQLCLVNLAANRAVYNRKKENLLTAADRILISKIDQALQLCTMSL